MNGFGWAWVVLGDSRGSQRIRAALDAVGAAAPPRDRAVALLLAGWIEASTGDLAPALHDILEATDLAEDIGDVELQARCSYHLAYVVSHQGEWSRALELTDRSRRALPRSRPPVGSGRELAVRGACGDLVR